MINKETSIIKRIGEKDHLAVAKEGEIVVWSCVKIDMWIHLNNASDPLKIIREKKRESKSPYYSRDFKPEWKYLKKFHIDKINLKTQNITI